MGKTDTGSGEGTEGDRGNGGEGLELFPEFSISFENVKTAIIASFVETAGGNYLPFLIVIIARKSSRTANYYTNSANQFTFCQ
jgi:hypothetical protein